eukprot:jgi/Tetstr1/459367/TSEL_004747.t1
MEPRERSSLTALQLMQALNRALASSASMLTSRSSVVRRLRPGELAEDVAEVPGGWAALPDDVARDIFQRLLADTSPTPADLSSSGALPSGFTASETGAMPRMSDISSARLVCRDWASQASAVATTLRPNSKPTPRHWASRFHDLRTLDLSNAKKFRLGNADLPTRVCEWFDNLKQPSTAPPKAAPSSAPATTAGLRTASPIASLKLEALYAANRRLRASGAVVVGCLSSLTTLDLADAMLTDAALAELRPLSKLRSLALKGSHRMSDWVLRDTLRNFTSLTELDLMCCYRAVTDVQLERLEAATCLRSLNLRGCDRLTPAGLAHLTRFTALESLDVGCLSALRDDTLGALSRLPHLRALDVRAAPALTDGGLLHLSRLTTLDSLSFAHCHNISAHGVEDLLRYDNPLPRLRVLDLSWGPKLRDTALLPIAKLTALQTLRLRNSGAVTDDGLDILAAMTSLTHLDLSSCHGLTNAGLARLASLTALRRLELAVCDNVGDSGIRALAANTALEYLDLRCCVQLRSAAVDALARLPCLKGVDLRLCHGIGKSARARIQHLLVEGPPLV